MIIFKFSSNPNKSKTTRLGEKEVKDFSMVTLLSNILGSIAL